MSAFRWRAFSCCRGRKPRRTSGSCRPNAMPSKFASPGWKATKSNCPRKTCKLRLAQIGREAARHSLRLETRQNGQQTEWRLVAPEKKETSQQVYYPHPTLEVERLRGETRRGSQAISGVELRRGRNGRAILIDNQRRVVRYQGEAGQRQSRQQAESPEPPQTATSRGRRR